jgi:hypothetical protein
MSAHQSSDRSIAKREGTTVRANRNKCSKWILESL